MNEGRSFYSVWADAQGPSFLGLLNQESLGYSSSGVSYLDRVC